MDLTGEYTWYVYYYTDSYLKFKENIIILKFKSEIINTTRKEAGNTHVS
jgi:hypothetical protein